jgi:hypothetical protein
MVEQEVFEVYPERKSLVYDPDHAGTMLEASELAEQHALMARQSPPVPQGSVSPVLHLLPSFFVFSPFPPLPLSQLDF